jgi:hypothetical protein
MIGDQQVLEILPSLVWVHLCLYPRTLRRNRVIAHSLGFLQLLPRKKSSVNWNKTVASHTSFGFCA